MREDEAQFPPQDAVSAGLRGACPRCGQGKLFDGLLKVRPACQACGLDYGFADAGDGPAVFVMLLVGFIVTGFALWFEFTVHPSIWLHFLVTLPFAVIVCLGSLRLLKGLLIALQYRHNASEGRIDRD
ncbi:DUF983 domain-containing protein [Rhizobium sp. SSA_523]|uniref:DUF983 domain-containing protein n=1 Tax=Rhizobium sp. SSA_523 TaxID=2952477 RepID=UPI002090BCFA|nr:DUF983 domain-containing protein [Rhizobium sp. SSA_523]MCO5731048.1 DUF983 domain-containing protein [Rhizobium sp. SSA_523]WKC24149.1 DUF983 domain-containing protein [Rhizobium sp. SSA_523]